MSVAFKLPETRGEFEELVVDIVKSRLFEIHSPLVNRLTKVEEKIDSINENLKLYRGDFLKLLEINESFRKSMEDNFERFRAEIREENRTFRDRIEKSNEKFKDEIKAEFSNFRKEIDKRFESIDKRFESIDRRFESIDKRFEKIDERFEEINKQFIDVYKTLNDIQASIIDLQKSITRMTIFFITGMGVIATLFKFADMLIK